MPTGFILFKKPLPAVLLIAATVFLPLACKTKKPVTPPPIPDCTTISASYSNDIAPIINNNCMPCHEAGSLNGDFTSYEKLSIVAKDGELDRRALLLKDMPPLGPLPEEDRKKIRCWLDNGALNN